MRKISCFMSVLGRTLAILACAGGIAGCSIFGIVRHVPMVEIRDVSVAVPAGAAMADVILRAAAARKWSASVLAPDVVRCRIDANLWNIVVDVRHSGNSFSIEYVSSEGLFYRADRRDIHNTYNRQVEALRQRIQREATLVAPVVVVSNSGAAVQATAPAAKPYTIETFSRESGNGFSYSFVLALTDASAADMTLSRRIQADLRESVRSDYAAATGTKDTASLRIGFPKYEIRNGKVEGRAEVMTVELLEFIYDSDTKRGRLAVKVNPRQYDQTRQWVRNNIATLAQDKNSSLFNTLTGTVHFKIGSEVLRDDNVLEVEFQAGE